MREVKFRALNRKGEWVYGICGTEDEVNYDKRIYGLAYFFKMIQGGYSNRNTLSQFTGIKDKNGKEIYEGDIARVKGLEQYYEISTDNDLFLVEFNYGYELINDEVLSVYEEGIKFSSRHICAYTQIESSGISIEVVGNKFEDNRLLELVLKTDDNLLF